MKEISEPLEQTSLWDTNIFTSLQESEVLFSAFSGQASQNISESSQADSLARISLMPEKEQALKENEAGYGRICTVSFATYDLTTFAWKTLQLCLTGDYQEYSGTWPRAGMMLSGKCCQLQPLVPPTRETAFSLLPTPMASDATTGAIIGEEDTYKTTSSGTLRRYTRTGKDCSLSLGRWVQFWPTPVANDDNKSPEAHLAMKARMKGGPRKTITSLNVMVKAVEQGMYPAPAMNSGKPSEATHTRNSQPLSEIAAQGRVSGQLNPQFVEWLMGYPIGWTDLED